MTYVCANHELRMIFKLLKSYYKNERKIFDRDQMQPVKLKIFTVPFSYRNSLSSCVLLSLLLGLVIILIFASHSLPYGVCEFVYMCLWFVIFFIVSLSLVCVVID